MLEPTPPRVPITVPKYSHHAGGLINNVGHTIGWQDYPSKDTSVNNPFLGVFVWGEGWHNNHHANPNDWLFGLKWWQIDVAGYLIRLVKQ